MLSGAALADARQHLELSRFSLTSYTGVWIMKMKKPVKPPSQTLRQGQDQGGQGNRRNISPEAHRRASIVARTLMGMPSKGVK